MYKMRLCPEEEVQERIRLMEYNRRFMRETADVSCCMEDETGRCIAGLTGWRADDFVMVDLLWVDDACRGQGLGGRLLAFAEEEGKRLGAKRVELSTFGFQAPGFYEKMGYRRFAALENCMNGYGHYFYVKEL